MIYLDHAATSPMSKSVVEAMWPYLSTNFANASSVHDMGKAAARGLEHARSVLAGCLNCSPGEIIFTSGGTESNNLGIQGFALANPKGKHIITSAIEHEAVLETCSYLQRFHGFEITILPVDGFGSIDDNSLLSALRPDTTLCSIQYANNEVGTIQPIKDISNACHEMNVAFHCDGVQAGGSLPIDVEQISVDLLALSAHKFGGPKGIGLLYVKNGSVLEPIIHGGGQERGLRSGTSNVAGAVGMAEALRLSQTLEPDLRDYLINSILSNIPKASLTGHPSNRLPHHASFCFKDVSGESILVELGARGIACSSGSACSAGSDEPSYVLKAMNLNDQLAQGALRFTLGIETTQTDIDTTISTLSEIVIGL